MSNDGKSNFGYYFNSFKINAQEFDTSAEIIYKYFQIINENIWVTIVDGIPGEMRANVYSFCTKNFNRSKTW